MTSKKKKKFAPTCDHEWQYTGIKGFCFYNWAEVDRKETFTNKECCKIV